VGCHLSWRTWYGVRPMICQRIVVAPHAVQTGIPVIVESALKGRRLNMSDVLR
jgi:hypothetical protein